MGYCMNLRDYNFLIKNESKAAALAAIKELANHLDWMQGGGFEKGKQVSWWYSWTNTEEYVNATTLEEAMDAWGWKPLNDIITDDIDGLDFNGEKIGQEEILFNAIAPYVEENCYIEMEGEDGYIWRWIFKKGKCIEVAATLTFNEQE
jgi:hypothetical protein